MSIEMENLNISTRNPQVVEILQIVFRESISVTEMSSIISGFWNKYDSIKKYSDKFENTVFDVLSMYILDCAYRLNGPTNSVLLKALYFYLAQLYLSSEDRHENAGCAEDSIKNDLANFTSFNSEKIEEILIDALIECSLQGNYGVAVFLLKFGLLDIPNEESEKSKKIVDKLVDRFNNILHFTPLNERTDDKSLNSAELLELMKRSDISFRRCLMTFLQIIVIVEQRLRLKIESDSIKEAVRHTFVQKLSCLRKIFDGISEADIVYKDIETFSLNILNPLLSAEFGKSVLHFIRYKYRWSISSNPRLLREISRYTIRKNLGNSKTFPEQVNQLDISANLKEFLLFDRGKIFDILNMNNIIKLKEDTANLYLVRNFLMGLQN